MLEVLLPMLSIYRPASAGEIDGRELVPAPAGLAPPGGMDLPGPAPQPAHDERESDGPGRRPGIPADPQHPWRGVYVDTVV